MRGIQIARLGHQKVTKLHLGSAEGALHQPGGLANVQWGPYEGPQTPIGQYVVQYSKVPKTRYNFRSTHLQKGGGSLIYQGIRGHTQFQCMGLSPKFSFSNWSLPCTHAYQLFFGLRPTKNGFPIPQKLPLWRVSLSNHCK